MRTAPALDLYVEEVLARARREGGAKLECQITDPEHPHSGEAGYIQINAAGDIEEGSVARLPGSGKLMVKVFLPDCKHGTDGCFVTRQPGALRFGPDRRQR